jgi:hypothetical protein
MEIAGKRVVNATKPVTITITPKDVATGDNKNPSSCAAAKAAKHSIEECISARVHIGRVYIEQEKKWVRYNTPDSLKQEIIAFDRGGTFAPGQYVLRPVSGGETAAGRLARKDKNRSLRAHSNRHPRKLRVKIAKIKRHEVTGIRPKGANR